MKESLADKLEAFARDCVNAMPNGPYLFLRQTLGGCVQRNIGEITAALREREARFADTPALLPPEPTEGLRAAAQAVLDRWDSPVWRDVEPTAKTMNTLRVALRALPLQNHAATPAEPIYLQTDEGWFAISLSSPRYCFKGTTLKHAKEIEQRALEFWAKSKAAKADPMVAEQETKS